MVTFLLELLFLQALSAPATQPSLPKPVDNQKCVIAGVVLRATSGEPLKKAVLSLKKSDRDEPAKDAITDANGHFEIKDVDPGRYDLEASHNGYVPQKYGQRTPDSPGTLLALTPSQHLLDISFKLMPAAAITGHVYDEDGEPVTSAEVQVLHFQYEDGIRKLLSAQETQTDDLGEYRIFGLNPGRYYIAVSYDPNRLGIPAGGYATQYYPSADDPSRAVAVELRAGDDLAGTDFNLLPVRTFQVTGHVYDAVNHRPGVHATVWLVPRDREVQTTYFTPQDSVQDAQGAFELRGVRSGSYYLFAASVDGVREYTTQEAVDVADADVRDVHVVIGPGIDLMGRIRVEGDARLDLNVLSLTLQPHDSGSDMGDLVASIKPDGSFSIPNVSDGNYQLQLQGLPEDYYLKAERASGRDVLGSDLNVSRKSPPAALELVLSANGARVSGHVLKEEKPFPGASVVLVPEGGRNKRERRYQSTSTDQNGQFSMRGVAPGSYTLLAWEAMEPGAYQDPDFLRAYENRGKAIVVEEGARVNSQVDLIAAEPAVAP